jgi:hypothetical protein
MRDRSPDLARHVVPSSGEAHAFTSSDRVLLPLATHIPGSDRSTRPAVAEVKPAYRLGHARVHRLWVTEPCVTHVAEGGGRRMGGIRAQRRPAGQALAGLWIATAAHPG